MLYIWKVPINFSSALYFAFLSDLSNFLYCTAAPVNAPNIFWRFYFRIVWEICAHVADHQHYTDYIECLCCMIVTDGVMHFTLKRLATIYSIDISQWDNKVQWKMWQWFNRIWWQGTLEHLLHSRQSQTKLSGIPPCWIMRFGKHFMKAPFRIAF